MTAVAVGRQTIVYLLPGLTAAERKSALLRVRCSARVGHGPSMPPFALAKALAADRLRGAMLTLAAAMRRHPVLLVPFAALVLSVTVLVVVLGTAGATPGRLAGPEPLPGVTSPPVSWHRFARHPEPLAWRDYRLRTRHDRHQYASRRRGAAAHRTDGHRLRFRANLTQATRSPVAVTSAHRLARRQPARPVSARQHRTRHRWHGPAPRHLGIPAAAATLSHGRVRP